MRRPFAGVLAVLAACALALAACAKDKPSTGAPAGGAPTSVSLKVSQTRLGQVLTDGDGRTVYAFTQDEGGKSVCVGGCAEKWPPLAQQGQPKAGDGVDAALLGTIARDDGGTQLTYNKMPLYHFASDQSPGDVKGQAVGGVWFAVSAAGALVKSPASRY